jgi:hypothetical protein
MVQQHEDDDHAIVEHFFSLKGLVAERIPETVSKTPDFKVKRGAEVVAFCEVKSPQDIFNERLTDAILSGKGGIIETGYGNDYRQARCIERAAQKAAAQFRVANPAHAVPNILTVVNHDTYADVEDFVQSLTGNFRGLAVAQQAIQSTIPEIDLYIWIDQKGRGAEPEPRIIYNHKAALKNTVRALLQL